MEITLEIKGACRRRRRGYAVGDGEGARWAGGAGRGQQGGGEGAMALGKAAGGGWGGMVSGRGGGWGGGADEINGLLGVTAFVRERVLGEMTCVHLAVACFLKGCRGGWVRLRRARAVCVCECVCV